MHSCLAFAEAVIVYKTPLPSHRLGVSERLCNDLTGQEGYDWGGRRVLRCGWWYMGSIGGIAIPGICGILAWYKPGPMESGGMITYQQTPLYLRSG